MRKIALITGVTAGIGEATAHKLAQEGFNLIITGRRKNILDELQKTLRDSYNIDVLALYFDVCQYNEVEQHLGNLPDKRKER